MSTGKEPTYQPISDAQRAEKEAFPNPCHYTVGNFRTTFRTPFEQYAHRNGHGFTVLRELSAEEKQLEHDEPMYLIRFDDGAEITAWGEEVCD